ncbi:hypothetical protein K449DRAFT_463868 [Hypoxylon sp. EC38]|nr:hypothetical protein K449DRAFT_463868 [Hypoxylon sp. EC38]
MCFIEYMGYTCGHTSMPVKRPCPLTTQQHSNPCCPVPAARPILSQSMCPACARILHGRYVNIIEHEHRFMHERGACHCAVQFPFMQRPRVIQHEHPEPEVTSTYVYESGLEGVTAGAAKKDENENGEKNVKVETDVAGSSPSGSPTELTPESARSPTGKFNFSPSASVFTPGQIQVHGQGETQGTEVVPYEQMPTSSIIAYGSSNATSSFNTDRRASFSSDNSKGKGKGKGKQRNAKKSSPPKQYRKYNEGYPRYQQQHPYQQQQRPRRTSPSAAAHGAPKLAPLFEERVVSGQKLEVSVRMKSIYGAEWIQDHAGLHHSGRCKCEIKFEKYPAKYMPLLEEAASDPDYGTNPVPDGVVAADDDGLHHDGNGNSNATTYTPTTSLSPKNKDSSTPYTSAAASGYTTAQTTVEPSTEPHIPGPAYPNQFYSQGQSGSATSPSSPNFSAQPGRPARWSCSPYDTALPSGATPAPRPVDMQTIWYDMRETPIAGLPVGAGPEGDSHMPAFEKCDLGSWFYQHQRAASF